MVWKNRSWWRQNAQMNRLRGFRLGVATVAVLSHQSPSVTPPPPLHFTSYFQSTISTCPRMISSPSSKFENHGNTLCRTTLKITPSGRTVAILAIAAIVLASNVSSTSDIFSNSFLVRFRRNVERHEAHQIAHKHGFVSMGPVSWNFLFETIFCVFLLKL